MENFVEISGLIIETNSTCSWKVYGRKKKIRVKCEEICSETISQDL